MADGFAELRDQLRRGEETAEQAVEARLALLRAADERIGGVAFFGDARALADARALDRAFAVGGPAGPLHGLPVTVKDWIDVEGFPCAGETADRERRPGRDATVVARLRAAGAVVVAKTMPWGEVVHPGDPTRSVGGSSSGEAALVAAGASVLGIGSDSGGSIRLPAAWAGVCGLRPTAGRVPTTGHFPRVGPRSDGRTQIGPLASSIDALEHALAVLAGPDGRDPAAAPVPMRPSATADLPVCASPSPPARVRGRRRRTSRTPSGGPAPRSSPPAPSRPPGSSSGLPRPGTSPGGTGPVPAGNRG